MIEHLSDMVGIRIILPRSVSDIYRIAEMIARQSDDSAGGEGLYQNWKPNG